MKPISLKIEDDLYTAIANYAKAEKKSRSEAIRALILTGLQSTQESPPEAPETPETVQALISQLEVKDKQINELLELQRASATIQAQAIQAIPKLESTEQKQGFFKRLFKNRED